MIYTGIVAGGRGTRMKSDVPKQFIHIGDKPILIHTVEKFLSMSDKIYIACPVDKLEYTKKLILKYINFKKIKIIAGGTTRMESMLSILSNIISNEKINDDDIIITHDGIRPFVTEKIIDENIKAARKYEACGTYVGAIDTIAMSNDGKTVQSIPPRDTVLHAQTPQTFKLSLLKEIFAKNKNSLEEFTDLCGMAHETGVEVHIVEGARENIKITTSCDLKTAEGILKTE